METLDLYDVHQSQASTDDDSEINSMPSPAAEDLRMETVLEDSAVHYVFVTPHSPEVEPSLTPTSLGTKDNQDFVVVSKEDFDDDDNDDTNHQTNSWWTSIQKYAFLAAHQGGQWTSSMLTYTNPVTNVFRTGSIHDCYDWVSDTSVDGGRLILPGQLVVWDDPNETVLDQALAAERNDSSTIMVSAYDLLACQSSGRDEAEVISSNTTLSFHSALLKVSKRRVYDLTKATGSVFTVSTSMVSQRITSLISQWESRTGLLSNTAGLVYRSLDWYFPSYLGTDEVFYTEQAGTENHTIELSTVKSTIDDTKEHFGEDDTNEGYGQGAGTPQL